MNDKENSFGQMVNQVMIIIAVFFVVKWFWMLCIWLTPSNSRGEKNKLVTALIGVVLVFGMYSGCKILGSNPSHPSSHYTPAEWRTLAKRKCVFEYYHEIQMRAQCVGFDHADIPSDLQNTFLYRADEVLSQRGIRTVSNDLINIERYQSNDPEYFIHPDMTWRDGHHAGVSVIKFWDWSMLDDSKY